MAVKSTIKANTKNDLQYFREEVDFLTAEWIFYKAHIYGAIYRCQHYWWNFCENIKNNILYLL